MLSLAIRIISGVFALGLLLGGLWGPQIEVGLIVAAVALTLSATLSSTRLQQLPVLLILASGIGCLLVRISLVIATDMELAEMVTQLIALAVCSLLISGVLIREVKAKAQAAGWI